MGKGDIKSRKGKISNGSYGNSRRRADNKKPLVVPAAKTTTTAKPVAKKTA
jgi:ribosomal small subunit protein bTHX